MSKCVHCFFNAQKRGSECMIYVHELSTRIFGFDKKGKWCDATERG